MTFFDENDPDPVRDAWNEAAARPRRPGSTKGLVRDAEPETCAGALEALVHPTGAETLCPHLRETHGRLSWWTLLEQPGHLMCGRCMPAEYVELLSKPRRKVWRRCSCCGGLRWLAGPRIVRLGTGTAIGLLCGPCAAQETPGLVTADWR